jgi:hypothetical protein
MELKKTVTSIFMVPTLKIDRASLKDNGFLNGYYIDKRRDTQYEGCIYLLFKPEDLDKFRSFLDDEYERTKNVIDDYDYEDGFVVVVYKLDPKWKKDFALVREGLYSQTSKDFQRLFPQIIKADKKRGILKDQLSLQFRVFTRSTELLEYWENKLDVVFTDDMELWDGFHIENETLDLEKLKQEEEVI